MERVRGPAKKFLMTEKQVTFATKMAQYQPDQINDSVMKRLVKESGFAASSIRRLKTKDKIFELASYIRNDTPYEIDSADQFVPDNLGKIFTVNMEMFCQEIAADPFRNVKIAADRAGYPNPSYGYDLIGKQRIQDRIKDIQKERRIKFQPNINNLLMGLFIEANSNMADFVKDFDGEDINFRPSDEIPRDQMGCIKEIKKIVKGAGTEKQTSMALKLKDSHRAKSLLFKYFGLGVEGTNDDPREFIQDVISFSQKVSQIDAFPMASVPGPMREESEEKKQEQTQEALIQPILPKQKRADKETIQKRVKAINTPKNKGE